VLSSGQMRLGYVNLPSIYSFHGPLTRHINCFFDSYIAAGRSQGLVLQLALAGILMLSRVIVRTVGFFACM
jgi:hypothetical protein